MMQAQQYPDLVIPVTPESPLFVQLARSYPLFAWYAMPTDTFFQRLGIPRKDNRVRLHLDKQNSQEEYKTAIVQNLNKLYSQYATRECIINIHRIGLGPNYYPTQAFTYMDVETSILDKYTLGSIL